MTGQARSHLPSTVCPRCQRLNACQRSALLGSQVNSQTDAQVKSQADFQCWCKTVDLESIDLAAVTRDYQGSGSASCLCQSCLKEIAENSLES